MKKESGYSFIEVLVAMLVLGISVLAFAGLQIRALDTTNMSNVRSQAITLASELIERMRANSSAVALTQYSLAANYNLTTLPGGAPSTWGGAPTGCMQNSVSATPCGPADMAKYDIHEIMYLAGQLLPAGVVRGSNCVAGTNVFCVFITWGGTTTCTSNASPNCVVMQAIVQ